MIALSDDEMSAVLDAARPLPPKLRGELGVTASTPPGGPSRQVAGGLLGDHCP